MYNPYNWKIKKAKNDVKMMMDIYPMEMNHKCILDELTEVCNELALIQDKRVRLEEELNDVSERSLELMNKKKRLIDILSND